MRATHQGYEMTGMVGNMSATVRENDQGNGDGYVEIYIAQDSAAKSYDLKGLDQLIMDLTKVLELAQKVDLMNASGRKRIDR